MSTSMPSKVDMKTCTIVPPQHPCDPLPACDPNKEPKGDCELPYLCKEKLKNPEFPDTTTRCRPGMSIGVRACVKPPPPHPCDTPLPCSDVVTKKEQCDVPPLCQERLKNKPEKKTRWVKCTNSKGEVVQHRVFRD